MMVATSRQYSGEQDRHRMLEFLAAVRPPDRITDFPSLVDLHELLALAAVRANTRLWLDANGRLVGFALVDHYQNLHFELDRPAARPEIAAEMVAWGEGCIRRAMAESGESLTLDASCRADDSERIALLERHGFAMQDLRSLQMARPLSEPIPEPEAPAGFALRHVLGEHEAEALAALHRAAFGSEQMTVEERLAMMRVPEYEPALDLVAVAADGRLAATCMCWISREENARSGRNEGYTDPVATDPDFQRRGLARALLLTGLHALKQRGVDTAVLGTSSENVAMQRAAEAVGFRTRSTKVWFARPVSPGKAPLTG